MPTLTVVVEQCLAPVPGGTGRYTAELTKAMAATAPSGWTVHTVSAWHRDVDPARIQGASGPRRLLAGRRALSELWACGLPPWVGGDSVHATTPLAPRRRNRLVVTVHDTVPWTHPETLTSRGVDWHKRMIARAARKADAIVVPTRAVADDLGRLFALGDRVHVIPHGVTPLPVPADAAERRARLGVPDDYVMTLSTLEPRKGLDVLLEALGRPELDGLRLVVVGQPGWGGVEVATAAGAARLDPSRISVLGKVDDQDLGAVLGAASLLVVPSRAEGFGLPVLEAMASGVPVVHSDVPALVEVAGGAGRAATAGNAEALAGAVVSILSDAATTRAMREAGLRRSAQFTWSNTAMQTWSLHTSSSLAAAP